MDALEMRVKAEGIDNIDDMGASPMAYAYLEAFRDDTASADFSHKDKGLTDPGQSIHQELGILEHEIALEQENINLSSRMAAPNKEQDPRDAVSMKNVKITLNEHGEITIDGSFSASGALDAEARTRAMQILEEKLAEKTANGGESNLLTGLRQLRLNHDEEFGEEKMFAKTGTVTFDGDTSETFIDAPEAKIAIHNEMESVVMKAIATETGVELKPGSIMVDEEGRVTAKNLPPTAESEKVRRFIDSLNTMMEEENEVLTASDLWTENNGGEPVRKTADELKNLLEELESYQQKTLRHFPYSGL